MKLSVQSSTTPDGRHAVVAVAADAAPTLAQVADALAEPPDSGAGQDVSTQPEAVRVAAVGDTRDAALAVLADRLETVERSAAFDPRVAFMFTGQGAQAVGMGRGLMTHATFRHDFTTWCNALSEPGAPPLRETMHGGRANEQELANTWNAQRALVALEAALASLWLSAGVRPTGVIGHSIGELTAAHVAGVMDADATATLVRHRARLMGSLPRGGVMVAVRASLDEVARFLGPGVSIAASNGPRNTVISGVGEDVGVAQEKLEQEGFACQSLNVSHAFHSASVEPMLGPLRDAASDLAFSLPRVALASNVTGALMHAVPSADYWADHVRGTVRFAKGLEALHQSGCRTFVELGPSPVLKRLGSRSRLAECTWLASLETPEGGLADLLNTGVRLFECGVDIDWAALTGQRRPARLDAR